MVMTEAGPDAVWGPISRLHIPTTDPVLAGAVSLGRVIILLAIVPGLIFGGIVVAAASLVLLAVLIPTFGVVRLATLSPGGAVLATLIVVGAALGLFVVVRNGRRERHLRDQREGKECARCLGREIEVVNTRYSSYDTTGTFTRMVRRYSADGDYLGHSEEDYEAPATETTKYTDFKCASCGHAWSTSW